MSWYIHEYVRSWVAVSQPIINNQLKCCWQFFWKIKVCSVHPHTHTYICTFISLYTYIYMCLDHHIFEWINYIMPAIRTVVLIDIKILQISIYCSQTPLSEHDNPITRKTCTNLQCLFIRVWMERTQSISFPWGYHLLLWYTWYPAMISSFVFIATTLTQLLVASFTNLVKLRLRHG